MLRGIRRSTEAVPTSQPLTRAGHSSDTTPTGIRLAPSPATHSFSCGIMKNALARLRELERQLEEHKRKASEILEESRRLLSENEHRSTPSNVRRERARSTSGRRKRTREGTTSR